MDVNLKILFFIVGPEVVWKRASLASLHLRTGIESELFHRYSGALSSRETTAHSHPTPHCVCGVMRFRRVNADDAQRGRKLCADGAEGRQLQLAAARGAGTAPAV